MSEHDDKKYLFHFYVIDETGCENELITRLHQELEKYLNGDYELQCRPLPQYIGDALNDNIFSVPALLMKQPGPTKQLIGDLARARAVMILLEDEEK